MSLLTSTNIPLLRHINLRSMGASVALVSRRGWCVLVALSALGACSDPLPATNDDPKLCPQDTGEFGNYGCARFAAVLETPDGRPAVGGRLSAMVLDPPPAGIPGGLNSQPSDSLGRVGLQFTWFNLPPPPDSAPMRIRAYRVDSRLGSELLDSMDVIVRYVAVGARPPVDTVRWRLARW